MRIAIVNPFLFTLPYDGNLCNEITAAGHNATLYGRPLRPGERFEEKNFIFIPLFYKYSNSLYPKTKIGKTARNVLKALEHIIDTLSLVKAITHSKTDVVHYQWMALPIIDYIAVAWLKSKKVVVIFTVHDTMPFNAAPTSRGQNIGWGKALFLFNALIVHTAFSKDTLKKYGIPPGKITVIPHGLLSFGPPIEILRKRGILILFWGTIKPYKGLDILLRAFAKVAPKRDVRLKIVGSCRGNIDEYLKLARSIGIANVVDFNIRFFDDADIPSILSEASLVIFPYRQIDSSGALLTTLTYNKPFIATDIGIFHELVSSPYALVPPNDFEALADKLEEVLDHPEKLAYLKTIAEDTKARVPSWKEIASLTIIEYEKCIHEHHRNASIS